jgi:hypothetical protein
MVALAGSARKGDEAMDHYGTQARETVHVERRELRGEIVYDEPRPGLRVIVGGMMRISHLDCRRMMLFRPAGNMGRQGQETRQTKVSGSHPLRQRGNPHV